MGGSSSKEIHHLKKKSCKKNIPASEISPCKSECGSNLLVVSSPAKSINPFEIDHIVHHILFNLSKKDLLKCRLINHIWEQEAQIVLQRQQHTIPLNSTNIEKYLLNIKYFAHKTQLHLNYHINIFTASPPQPLSQKNQIQLNYLIHETPWMASKEEEDIYNLFKCANQLIQLFGAKCIERLTWTPSIYGTSIRNWKSFVNLIQQISPGLKTFSINQDIKLELQVFLLTLTNLNLPELSTLHFESGRLIYIGRYSEGYHASLFQIHLIKSAPKLTNLTFVSHHWNGFSVLRNDRNHNVFAEVLSGIANTVNLKELSRQLGCSAIYVALTGQNQLLQIAECTCSVMFFKDECARDLLNRFLQDHCSSLISVDLISLKSAKDFELSKFLPQARHLCHFGCHVLPPAFDESKCYFSNVLKIEKLHSNCPLVVSAGVHFSILLRSDVASGKVYEGSVEVLQNKKCLLNPPTAKIIFTIEPWTHSVVSDDGESTDRDISTDTSDFVRKLYSAIPNLEKIVIYVKTDVKDKEANVFVKEVVKIFSEQIIGLKYLEIRNYCYDWLTEIMSESTMAVKNLQSLHTLGIPHQDLTFTKCFCNSLWNHKVDNALSEEMPMNRKRLAAILKATASLNLTAAQYLPNASIVSSTKR